MTFDIHPNSTIRQCSNEYFGQSIISSLSTLLFLHNTNLIHNVMQKRKSIVYITSRFVPTNEHVLLVHVNLAFVEFLSGTVLVDGYNQPIFILGVVIFCPNFNSCVLSVRLRKSVLQSTTVIITKCNNIQAWPRRGQLIVDNCIYLHQYVFQLVQFHSPTYLWCHLTPVATC